MVKQKTRNNKPPIIMYQLLYLFCAYFIIFYWNGQLVWTPALGLYL